MLVGIKDFFKFLGISVIACCAVFVCTLFLNYNIDVAAMKKEIVTEEGLALYEALVSMGKVTAAVSGGCLVVTSVVMLLFYVKNYVDTHGKELGILKAMGYSDIKISLHFWVFGLSVFIGCIVGYGIAFLYMPTFYEVQNAEGYFPKIPVGFHPQLLLGLVALPTLFFMGLSILFAYSKLKSPVLDLLRERREHTVKIGKDGKDTPFLKGLSTATLKSKKMLVFFVAFSAFCFSAMVQMSLSMEQLASATFAWMILLIGLILAFMTLLLSLSNVVKGNTKTIAMMRVFGYEDKLCRRAILGGYRPVSYVGFAVGTGYQYALLKITVTFIFSGVENIPEYTFDFRAFFITLAAFILVYEGIMLLYGLRIKKLSLKSVMQE